ncbi:MAG: GAF domain-containing protein, partial [Planctomycetales bacterium]|nr:GAF domain-containing protein [Planctomycetales bacterium]
GEQVDLRLLRTGDRVRLGATVLLYTGSPRVAAASDPIAIADSGEDERVVSAVRREDATSLLGGERVRPDRLQLVYRAAAETRRTLDLDDLLSRILALLFEGVPADRGCIMLFDEAARELRPVVRRDRRGETESERLAISRTILDYVLDRDEGVLTSNARNDDRWGEAASIVRFGVREAICAPMRGRYGLVGAIYVDTTTDPHLAVVRGDAATLSNEDLHLVVAVAHQAALAVEDTRHYSAMVQAERLAAAGQTIAVLSHHIKNILQGVRGASFLIEEGLKKHDEETVRRGWQLVERNQNRIYDLVMDMLAFGKEREPECEEENLNSVVGEVIELTESVAREAGVSLAFSPNPEIPSAMFDREGLHRAVLNVVGNAVDACREGGGSVEVSIGFNDEAGALYVEVTDTGEGIPAADLAKLFTPFYSSKGSRGTGLGLSVSKKIMNEHGGDVVVESTVGEGSRFRLELPWRRGPGATQTLPGRILDRDCPSQAD